MLLPFVIKSLKVEAQNVWYRNVHGSGLCYACVYLCDALCYEIIILCTYECIRYVGLNVLTLTNKNRFSLWDLYNNNYVVMHIH